MGLSDRERKKNEKEKGRKKRSRRERKRKKRKNIFLMREEREFNKILLLFLAICYSAHLYMAVHYSNEGKIFTFSSTAVV